MHFLTELNCRRRKMKVTWTTAVLCALALCSQLQSGAAAPKQRQEDVCRSVGALKFDASQRPMQRVRHGHAANRSESTGERQTVLTMILLLLLLLSAEQGYGGV